MQIRVLFTSVILIFCSALFSQELQFERLPDLIFEEPVDLSSTYIPGDNRLFVLEKTGKIFIIVDPDVENPEILETPFLDFSSVVNDDFEGGLLGLSFHPDYENNGYFFLNYTFNDPNNGNEFATRITRLSVSADDMNIADPSSEIEVMSIVQPKKNHNGGDIAFGPDGYLYIPTGDGGGAGDQYKNGQNRQSLMGKVLRIDINTQPYSIPADNPFAFDDETLDEIWSLGWRNPWKVAFDRETGDFWAADVGQNEIEEVDMEPAGDLGGKNYGWNCFEGSLEYDPELCPGGIPHTPPVFEYDQSQGWKSITGGHVYRGTRHTDLIGKYIFTDYEDSRVFWLTTEVADNTFETERYDYSGPDLPYSVTTFGESSKGELYFATLDQGYVWRVFTNVINSTVPEETSLFTIEPNPSSDIIHINYDGQNVEEVTIVSVTVKKIKSSSLGTNRFDISGLATGLYYLQIQLDDKFIQSQFSKM